MEAIRVTDIAKIENVDRKTIEIRHNTSILHVKGQGKAGRVSVIPAMLLEDKKPYLKCIEDIPEESFYRDTLEEIPYEKKLIAELKEENRILGKNEVSFIDVENSVASINDDLFLSADRIAQFIGYNRSVDIHIKAKRDKWKFKNIQSNGGAQKFYLLTDLPAEALIGYREYISMVYGIKKDNEIKQLGIYGATTEKKRNKANYRFEKVNEWLEFRKKYPSKQLTKADIEFVKLWKIEEPGQFKNIKTLQRWKKQYFDKGIDGLVDGYPENKPWQNVPFDAEAKAFLESIYLDQSQRGQNHCYQILAARAKKEGWQIPSLDKAKRHLRSLPKSIVVFHRRGQKEFDDTAFPSIIRDKKSILPGQAYNADDHMLDVSYGEGKSGQRLWITVWQDIATKKIVGVAFSESPDYWSVLNSFYMACQECIPEQIILDNGTNYREAAYTKKNTKVPETLKAPLQILLKRENVRFAKPGNARAKIIERTFLELTKEVKNLIGYTGRNLQNRPDDWYIDRQQGKFLSKEQIIKYVTDFLFETLNNKVEQKSGKTPNDKWNEYFSVHNKRTTDNEKLRHLLLCQHKPKLKIGRYGIEFGKDNHGNPIYYWDKWLTALEDRKSVIVKYNKSDLSKIWIYEPSGKPLGELPIYKYSNVDYLKGKEDVANYSRDRQSQVKQTIAYKQQLEDLHQQRIEVDVLKERADIRKGEVSFEKILSDTANEIKLNVPKPPSAKQKKEAFKKKENIRREAEEKILKSNTIPKREKVDQSEAWDKIESQINSKNRRTQ